MAAHPQELMRLLAHTGLPDPLLRMICKFAVEHPTAKLIKELEFEVDESGIFPGGYAPTLVFARGLPHARQEWKADRRSYVTYLDWRPRDTVAVRCLNFHEVSGEPFNAATDRGMNGHKNWKYIGNRGIPGAEAFQRIQPWWQKQWWEERLEPERRKAYRGIHRRPLPRRN